VATTHGEIIPLAYPADHSASALHSFDKPLMIDYKVTLPTKLGGSKNELLGEFFGEGDF